MFITLRFELLITEVVPQTMGRSQWFPPMVWWTIPTRQECWHNRLASIRHNNLSSIMYDSFIFKYYLNILFRGRTYCTIWFQNVCLASFPVSFPLNTYSSYTIHSLLYINNVIPIPPFAPYHNVAHSLPPLCARLFSLLLGLTIWVSVNGIVEYWVKLFMCIH